MSEVVDPYLDPDTGLLSNLIGARKQPELDGAAHFLSASAINRGAMLAAHELHQDNMLRGMNRKLFIDRLSYHYDQWNYVHPVREGNGRTQRVFWDRVAAEAGWQLDWRPVQGAVNDAACRSVAASRDFVPLPAMFDQVVSPGDTLPR